MDSKRRNFLSTTAAAVALTATGHLHAQTKGSSSESAPEKPMLAHLANPPNNLPKEIKKIEISNLRDLEATARKILPQTSFEYIFRAAGDGWTKEENEAAYKRFTIQPQYLSGYADADLTTSLLGTKIAMPIITTVMGAHGMVHVTAEAGTAKGTDAAKTLFTAPSQSTMSLEEIARASAGPKWFQLYLPDDQGKATELLQRAKSAGYLAIVLTIDGGKPSGAGIPSNGNFEGNKGIPHKANLGWDDVDFVQKVSNLPLILKGLVSPDLAAKAVQRGVSGIQLSNHGGKSLDGIPATITALPRVVEAVVGRIPIIVDGGIRRGQDVFKALALGATAVAIGRPILYGLGLGGWMGVQAVLEHLSGEFEMTMQLAGASSIGEISKRYLNV